MSQHIYNHIRKTDQKLLAVLDSASVQLTRLQSNDDCSTYFARLCRDIVGQQLSTTVAAVIFARFEKLFEHTGITPDQILSKSEEELRSVGLSWAKVKYIRDLAEKSQTNAIRYSDFGRLTDEEIIIELTEVNGIGRWTAEMFLIFTLGREDVFSFGDLGLRKGFQKLYQVPDDKLKQKMQQVTQRWSPYRSYGSLILWQYFDQQKKNAAASK